MMRQLGFTSLVASLFLLGCVTSGNDGGVDAGPDGERVILDGGGEPAIPPDGAAACPQKGCNYQTGMGCMAMQACLPDSDMMGGVVPTCLSAGAAKGGEACSHENDCIPGYICAQGACRKLCCGGDWTGCASPSEHCIVTLAFKDPMSGMTVDTGAMACFPINTCDALNPSSCPEPTTCQIVDPTGVTACFNEGTGNPGDPCPCKGGSLCVANKCRRLCKAVAGGGVPFCQAGEGACVHFTRDPDGVGECTP